MSGVLRPLIGLFVWSFLPGPGLLEAAEPATEWRAGAARVDTTPTRPVRMAGYASRTAPSSGVAHPLAAKALALADGRGTRAVIVARDVIAFRRTFRDRVVDRVKARYGLPGEGLVLFASHTHAGPALSEPAGPGARDDAEGLKNNIDYTRELEDKIVDLVGAAIAGLQPARLSYGVGRAHFALNRREPTAGGMIEAIERGRPIRSDSPDYCGQAFALGDRLTMVALSGEVVVDHATRLQKELGGEGRALWVAAYANDVVGYIPSVRVLKEGGYEGGESFYGGTWPAPWAEDVESIVVKAAHEVVKRVRGQ